MRLATLIDTWRLFLALRNIDHRQILKDALDRGLGYDQDAIFKNHRWYVKKAYEIAYDADIYPHLLDVSLVKFVSPEALKELQAVKSPFADVPVIGTYNKHGFFPIDGRHRIADAIGQGKDRILAYALTREQTAECYFQSSVGLLHFEG